VLWRRSLETRLEAFSSLTKGIHCVKESNRGRVRMLRTGSMMLVVLDVVTYSGPEQKCSSGCYLIVLILYTRAKRRNKNIMAA
jgi:hypothetical protein